MPNNLGVAVEVVVVAEMEGARRRVGVEMATEEVEVVAIKTEGLVAAAEMAILGEDLVEEMAEDLIRMEGLVVAAEKAMLAEDLVADMVARLAVEAEAVGVEMN